VERGCDMLLAILRKRNTLEKKGCLVLDSQLGEKHRYRLPDLRRDLDQEERGLYRDLLIELINHAYSY